MPLAGAPAPVAPLAAPPRAAPVAWLAAPVALEAALEAAPVAAPAADFTVPPIPIEFSTPLIVGPMSSGSFGRPFELDEPPAGLGAALDPERVELLLSDAGALDGLSVQAVAVGP